MNRKIKLWIAGFLGVLGFLMMCNDPELGIENYQFSIVGFLPNLIGVVLLIATSYICHKDNEKYGTSDEKQKAKLYEKAKSQALLPTRQSAKKLLRNDTGRCTKKNDLRALPYRKIREIHRLFAAGI